MEYARHFTLDSPAARENTYGGLLVKINILPYSCKENINSLGLGAFSVSQFAGFREAKYLSSKVDN